MAKVYIRVKAGSYRSLDMSNTTFRVHQFDSNGKFVSVYNHGQFQQFPNIFRIKLASPTSYEFVSQLDKNVNSTVLQPVNAVSEVVSEPEKTDEERIHEIAERFEILTDMTRAAISGDIRAMIVSGPPGVGKSYGVERQVRQVQLMNALGSKIRAEIVKGSATAIGLYAALYKYREDNCVLVFDDCDSLFEDPVCMNLLKGALDSGSKRKISWLSDSNMLRREEIPDSFEFNGSVIFLTNLDFGSFRSQKLRDHMEALQSRCHYLDLTMNTVRDRLLRIVQISRTGELFAEFDFSAEQEIEIIDFMLNNQTKLREISLRMAIKIAQLVKSFPDRWKIMASNTCMVA